MDKDKTLQLHELKIGKKELDREYLGTLTGRKSMMNQGIYIGSAQNRENTEVVQIKFYDVVSNRKNQIVTCEAGEGRGYYVDVEELKERYEDNDKMS